MSGITIPAANLFKSKSETKVFYQNEITTREKKKPKKIRKKV